MKYFVNYEICVTSICILVIVVLILFYKQDRIDRFQEIKDIRKIKEIADQQIEDYYLDLDLIDTKSKRSTCRFDCAVACCKRLNNRIFFADESCSTDQGCFYDCIQRCIID